MASQLGKGCAICAILSFASTLMGTGPIGFAAGAGFGIVAIVDFLKGGLTDKEII